MAKKESKKALTKDEQLKEALKAFDLKAFIRWVKKFQTLTFYMSFTKATEEVQMATMCKCICNRTDMMMSPAHRKAVKWLQEHKKSTRLIY